MNKKDGCLYRNNWIQAKFALFSLKVKNILSPLRGLVAEVTQH